MKFDKAILDILNNKFVKSQDVSKLKICLSRVTNLHKLKFNTIQLIVWHTYFKIAIMPHPGRTAPEKWVELIQSTSPSKLAIYLLVVLLVGVHGVSIVQNDDPTFQRIKNCTKLNKDIFEVINMAGGIEVKISAKAKEVLHQNQKKLKLQKLTRKRIEEILAGEPILREKTSRQKRKEVDIVSNEIREQKDVKKMRFGNDVDDAMSPDNDESDKHPFKEEIIHEDVIHEAFKEEVIHEAHLEHDFESRGFSLEDVAISSSITVDNVSEVLDSRIRLLEDDLVKDVHIMRKAGSKNLWILIEIQSDHVRYAHNYHSKEEPVKPRDLHVQLSDFILHIRSDYKQLNCCNLHVRFFDTYKPLPSGMGGLLLPSSSKLDKETNIIVVNILTHHRQATAATLIGENSIVVFVRFAGFVHVLEDGTSPDDIMNCIGEYQIIQIEGTFKRLAMPENGKLMACNRPLRIGYSIGPGHLESTGTLGVILRCQDGKRFGITNMHVTGPQPQDSAVVNMYNPSMVDLHRIDRNMFRQFRCGHVVESVIDKDTDVALIEITDDLECSTDLPFLDGLKSKLSYDPAVVPATYSGLELLETSKKDGLRFISIGRSSGCRFMNIISSETAVKYQDDVFNFVRHRNYHRLTVGNVNMFVNQTFAITTDKTSVQEGDSGSCLWGFRFSMMNDCLSIPVALLHSGIRYEGGFIGVYSDLRKSLESIQYKCASSTRIGAKEWSQRLEKFLE